MVFLHLMQHEHLVLIELQCLHMVMIIQLMDKEVDKKMQMLIQESL